MIENKKVTVDVKGLFVSFMDQEILNNINLSFDEKTITVLVGRSGSGKTTFLRSLNRLNEEFPNCRMKGRIEVDIGKGLQCAYDEKKPPEIHIQNLRRKVGMVFQTPQVLPVSIYRNIAMPLQLLENYKTKQAQEKVEHILQTVGLWDEVKDRLNSPAEILSGGQQQRLSLARTLALEPSILLLDEPTSSLDKEAAQKIEQLLLELKKSYTLIMVSHSQEQAQLLADRLITFDKGAIL